MKTKASIVLGMVLGGLLCATAPSSATTYTVNGVVNDLGAANTGTTGNLGALISGGGSLSASQFEAGKINDTWKFQGDYAGGLNFTFSSPGKLTAATLKFEDLTTSTVLATLGPVSGLFAIGPAAALVNSSDLYAWVVTDSTAKGGQYQISVSAVPVPGALLMFGSVLVGAGAAMRRQMSKQAASV